MILITRLAQAMMKRSKSDDLSIEQVWEVRGAHIANPVILRSGDFDWLTMPSGQCMFVRMRKLCNTTQRLVFGHARVAHNRSNMAHTTIIEELMELRDKARDEIAQKAKDDARASSMEGKIDISFDGDVAVAPASKRKSAITLDQRYVTFPAPSIVDIPSIEIVAMIEPELRKANPKTLSLHLTPPMLQYLNAVAEHQVRAGTHRAHPRNDHSPLGEAGHVPTQQSWPHIVHRRQQ